ncbi:DUF1294 domain-containing protein [Brevibacillus humidisoli]|uniref:DUF1294 domain-containing protein n=1 Tax=Brevibacillus humidisoli TaxID=2895522 RepID=UPI001E469BE1|nr:DUF1294 domain-containing protein [Brevibacillus humidisoli]UFJ39192.1 DUF1294 domain-containing protein [Brevibacillus humidisoli]
MKQQQKLAAHRKMRNGILACGWLAMIYGWYSERLLFLFAGWLLINLYSFGLMAADKRSARQHRLRIPESSLLMLAALGGAMGTGVGMVTFRHKTRHSWFVLGVPLLIVLHLLLFFRLAW